MRDDIADPVRVALVLDGDSVPQHVAFLTEAIDDEPGLCLAAVIRIPRARSAGAAAWLRDAWLRLDGRVSRPPEDALRRRPARVPSATPRLGPADPRLADLQFDVVLDPGLAPVPTSLDSLARFGRWRLTPEASGWPVLATQQAAGARALRAWVTQHRMREPPVTIAEAIVPCSDWSLARNQSLVRWQSAHLAIRALRRTAIDRDRGPAAVPAPPVPEPLAVDEPPPPADAPTPMSTPAVAGLVARLTWRVLAKGLQGALTRDEWFVALRRRKGDALPSSLAGFSPIPIAEGYVADPILVDDETGASLFVEAWDAAAGRGRVARLELPEGRGVPQRPRIVLETPTHLSYPTVVRWHDEWFLVPENWDGGRVDLYRGDPFPDRWRYVAPILDGIRAVDPTLYVGGGHLWLFLTRQEQGLTPWGELSLFWADDIAGPWHPHPANPIVTDARRARPAGRLFESDGSLIRPAQDCTGAYGRRIVLHRVDRLDETAYAETVIGTVEPTGLRGLERTHTYSRSTAWEALDGRRRTWRMAGGTASAAAKLRSLVAR